ncbi:MAG: CDP-alcohol phosphatidyltransferase family protein [Candidatus Caenarcaniphilales bacterium]|nr:CDP-alcohol phosphatidyltransferase family protein [Candidatus Caenarcaniphilales bacterium]
MFDEKFRAVFPRFAKWILQPLILAKVSPNQVTVFGFLLALLACYFVSQEQFILGIIIWWLSRLADGLDGLLARETKQKTAFGGYLDILLDMFAYSTMIFAFALVYPEHSFIWNLILVSYVLCITSTLAFSSILENLSGSPNPQVKEIIKNNNRSLKFTTGLAEGGETSLAYTFLSVLPLFWADSVLYVSLVWLSMVMLTVLQRSYLAFKVLKGV